MKEPNGELDPKPVGVPVVAPVGAVVQEKKLSLEPKKNPVKVREAKE